MSWHDEMVLLFFSRLNIKEPPFMTEALKATLQSLASWLSHKQRGIRVSEMRRKHQLRGGSASEMHQGPNDKR